MLTYDNLSSGNKWAVLYGDLVVADLADRDTMEKTLREFKPDAVMHFAAYIVVPESVRDPLKYYRNNTVNAVNLLDAMRECNIGRLIFSSTASVYGITEKIPITEDALQYLTGEGGSDIFNCGYGHGYSVKEVVKAVKEITGVDFKVEETARREGDPAAVMDLTPLRI